MTKFILPGQKWRHRNGIEYRVVCLTNEHSTRPEYPVTVVYQGENKRLWSKTKDDFIAKMTFVPESDNAEE